MLFSLGSEKIEELSSLLACDPDVGNVQLTFSTDPLTRTEGIELSQWIVFLLNLFSFILGTYIWL